MENKNQYPFITQYRKLISAYQPEHIPLPETKKKKKKKKKKGKKKKA